MSEQPKPVPNDQPRVVDLVKADLDARAAKGLATYGTYLQAFNGRDPAQDAYEEALDMANYLKQLCIERRSMEARIAILERERDGAQYKVSVQERNRKIANEQAMAVVRERDEARAQAARYREALESALGLLACHHSTSKDCPECAKKMHAALAETPAASIEAVRADAIHGFLAAFGAELARLAPECAPLPQGVDVAALLAHVLAKVRADAAVQAKDGE